MWIECFITISSKGVDAIGVLFFIQYESYCFLTISFLLFKHSSHSKLHVAYQWFHKVTKRLYHEKPRTAGISGAAGGQEGSG